MQGGVRAEEEAEAGQLADQSGRVLTAEPAQVVRVHRAVRAYVGRTNTQGS